MDLSIVVPVFNEHFTTAIKSFELSLKRIEFIFVNDGSRDKTAQILFNPWVIIGFLGQILFFVRFVVQWIASEKQKQCVIPVAFWYTDMPLEQWNDKLKWNKTALTEETLTTPSGRVFKKIYEGNCGFMIWKVQ